MKFLNNCISAALIIAAGLASASCDDLLDTKPQGAFTDEQLTDKEVPEFMNAAYAGLLNHFFGNNESFAGPYQQLGVRCPF